MNFVAITLGQFKKSISFKLQVIIKVPILICEGLR